MMILLGILLNTLIVAGLMVWLARGGGASWINTLNATSLSMAVGLFVILETAGAVLGMFIWAQVSGRPEALDRSLGYLGIWFGFLGAHVLVNAGTQIGKRVTNMDYVERKGAAKAALAAATGSPGVVTGTVESMRVDVQPTGATGTTGEMPATGTPSQTWVKGDPDAGEL